MENDTEICRKSSWSKQTKSKKFWAKGLLVVGVLLVIFVALQPQVYAAGISIDLGTDGTEGSMGSIELLFLFAILALAPSLLIMMTSFTRMVIVFSFLRTAIGIQQTPPNQIVIGLSLFMSFFVMQPVFEDIQTQAIEPYMAKEITQQVALDKMQDPLKKFMLQHTKAPDLNLFLNLAGEEEKLTVINPDNLMDLGLEVVVPAFITSELKYAFTIGFLLFLPFLVIDMIVSSTLMSMGMVMLPPSMIALPFKLMLFVIVDGWRLIIEMLIRSYLG